MQTGQRIEIAIDTIDQDQDLFIEKGTGGRLDSFADLSGETWYYITLDNGKETCLLSHEFNLVS